MLRLQVHVNIFHNLVPRVLVTLVQRWSGQQGPLGGSDPPWPDSRTSGSTAHVFDPMFQLTDAKILGLPVLLRKSGGSLYLRGPCWPLHPWTRVTRTLGMRLHFSGRMDMLITIIINYLALYACNLCIGSHVQCTMYVAINLCTHCIPIMLDYYLLHVGNVLFL